MANTHVLFATNTLSSSTSVVTFSNIIQTYTDLLLLISARCDYGALQCYVTFNGNSNSVYSGTLLNGNGSTTSSSRITAGTYFEAENVATSYTVNTFSNVELYIPNYTASRNKALQNIGVNPNSGASSTVAARGQLFSNTSAITSITITSGSNFVSGSTFYLYGIKNS